MAEEMIMEFRAEDLRQIVQSVFETNLNLVVEAGVAPWFPAPERLIASVNLSGGWQGTVTVESGYLEARRLAGRFLGNKMPEAVNDLVRDVFGELANMIAGNLKAVLNRGVRLSLPIVKDGSDCLPDSCGSEIAQRICFECQEGPFWLTIFAPGTGKSGTPS